MHSLARSNTLEKLNNWLIGKYIRRINKFEEIGFIWK